MHALTFAFKKVHLGFVEFGKELLRPVEGMTPARFDVLFAILVHSPVLGIAPRWPLARRLDQKKIRERLALHKSTVSKMIKRLIEIGWVTSSRRPDDRRRKIVELTEAGHAALRFAMRISTRRRVHRRWIEQQFTPRRHRHRKAQALRDDALFRFYGTVDTFAHRLGRRGTIAWPFPETDDG